jgi:hypothetical protein
MRSATELYPVKLNTSTATVGDVNFTLRQGLLDTTKQVEKTPNNVILRASHLLGVVTRRIEVARRLVQSWLQVEWYKAKSAEVPPTVLETFNTAREAATMEDETPTTTPEATTEASVRGTRPYCRQLIETGITDEKELLEAVRAKFPTAAFKMGDVRGQLRLAGKLDWTTRKGKPRVPKSEA